MFLTSFKHSNDVQTLFHTLLTQNFVKVYLKNKNLKRFQHINSNLGVKDVHIVEVNTVTYPQCTLRFSISRLHFPVEIIKVHLCFYRSEESKHKDEL